MSQINTNAILDASGGTTATVNGFTPTVSNMAGRNRIINGDMRIDQRNAGAAVTLTNQGYGLDRWTTWFSQTGKYTAQQNQGSVTPPVGFVNYHGITSSSAYTVTSTDYFHIAQKVEGYNIADLNWGTANAKTITVSFWVRSSLTGDFGILLRNGAGSHVYGTTYAISSANTWERKTITIVGPTIGTWDSTNGNGIFVIFGLGHGSSQTVSANGSWLNEGKLGASGATSVVGTSGATFYITGVQLEEGSVATPFEHRLYGQELALCQRYYYKTTPEASARAATLGYNATTTIHNGVGSFPVPLRITPTALEQSGTASNYGVAYLSTSATASAVPAFDIRTSNTMYVVQFTVASGLTAGQASRGQSLNANGFLAWSAEL